MRGVYRLEGKNSTGVKRSHLLVDTTEDPQLVDNLIERTEKATANVLFDQKAKAITNDPDMNRAHAMMGVLNSLDGILEENSSAGAAGSSAITPSATAPSGSTASGSTGVSKAEAEHDQSDDALSIFHSLKAFKDFNQQSTPTAKAKAIGPGPGPKEKAKAKAKPKQKAKAKKGEDETGRIEDMDPATVSSRGAGPAMNPCGEQDAIWLDETKEELLKLMDMSSARSGETEFKTDCLERTKEFNSFLSKVRTRKRQVKRRSADNREPALSQADELEVVACAFCQLIKNVMKGTTMAGDEYLAQVDQVTSHGAHLGDEVIMRIGRYLLLDDMKYKRWTSMLGESKEFVAKNHTSSESFSIATFMRQQMSVILQKLLKGIPLEKAACMKCFVHFLLFCGCL